jgi:hypothetical protein
MRRALPIAVVATLLAGCSGSDEPSAKQAELYMQGFNGRGVVLRAGTDVNRMYGEAEALKAKGDCAGAIPKLRKIANLGPGYENAQTALAECLMPPGSRQADDAYMEGVTWLSRAADAGWPEAQFELAEIHAFGPQGVRSTSEAGYWLALYQDNSQKFRVGFMPPAPERVAAVYAALPAADKDAGAERALTWQRHVWIPPTSTAAPGPTSRTVERGTGNSSASQSP